MNEDYEENGMEYSNDGQFTLFGITFDRNLVRSKFNDLMQTGSCYC